MNEYPKTCSRNEAIYIIKQGGKASAKGHFEGECSWRELMIVNGYVTHPNFKSIDSLPFLCGDDVWDYRIDSPVSDKSLSTVEALTELYKRKAGEVEFVGERGAYVDLTLFIGDDTNARIRHNSGYMMDVIPNTTWVRKAEKPKPVSGEMVIDNCRDYRALFSAVNNMNCQKVRVTYTIEAID